MTPQRCYTIPALAEVTGVSERSLYTWRSKGWLKPYAVAGSRSYYRIEEFDAAARESAKAAQEQALTSAGAPDGPEGYDEVIKRIHGRSDTSLRVRDRRTRRKEGRTMKS